MKSNKSVNDKFEILKDQSIEHNGRTLYRIRALKDVKYNVKKGDIGGFVQNEANLAFSGECWIYLDGKVYDNARLCQDAAVSGSAEVFENATVGSETSIWDEARVYGNARVSGMLVKENAQVFGNTELSGFSHVSGQARVYGTTFLAGQDRVGTDDDIPTREVFVALRKSREPSLHLRMRGIICPYELKY